MAPRYWLMLAALLLVVIAGVMFFGDTTSEPEPATAPPVAQAPAEPEPAAPAPPPQPEARPEPEPAPPPPEPEPQVTLPALNESDAFVREQADVLADSASIDQWLATDQLVRKFTVVVESLAEGQLAREPIAFLSPSERLSVVRRDGALYLNPQSYARFDRFASVVASVDPSQAVAMLRLVQPLMADAYTELGLQDVAVQQRMAQAIDVLLATPELESPPRLTQPSVYYEFADPELEALAPAQKQLLRMGPENARRIKAKLREVRALLQLEDAEG